MTFSQMLHNATQFQTEEGELEGRCCLCSTHTKKGHKIKMKANFTCAEYLGYGEVVCPYCQHILENSNTYRRTMFLLTENEFKTFKKKEIKDVIFNLPDEQFYLYLTKTWQKLGFILLDDALNDPNNDTVKVVIDYDRVTYHKRELEEYYDLVTQLRELKISKSLLENGNFELHHYRRLKEAFPDNVNSIVRKVQSLKGNPVWDLAIYISD